MMARLTVALLLVVLWAIPISVAQVGLPWPGPGTAHSSGAVPIALVGHNHQVGVSGSVTTSATNCTGANLLVLRQSRYTGNGAIVAPTDSQSNTWTQISTELGLASDPTVAMSLWYVQNASVSGTQTFTVALGATSEFISFEVACFSGTAAASALDQTNQAQANQPGSVTPGTANQLVVSGYLVNNVDNSVMSVNSSLAITDQDQFNGGVNEGGALAYIIQTTATAVNPTWSTVNVSTGASKIATFKQGP